MPASVGRLYSSGNGTKWFKVDVMVLRSWIAGCTAICR